MRFIKEDYRTQFFNKFISNEQLKGLVSGFSAILGDPTWWALKKPTVPKDGRPVKQGKKCSSPSSKPLIENTKCLKCILLAVKRARAKRDTVMYKCGYGHDGVVMPLIQGDKILGYISLCNIQNKALSTLMPPLKSSIGAVMDDVKKELELSKLYDTIRPRAIALSTIHTVHRVLSSTLNLDELLPKVARLCLQVLRAKRCHIMLFDDTKKYLASKAFIDIDDDKAGLKAKVKIGRGVEGRAAEKGEASLKPSYICVPLIDEDVMGVISASQKINKEPFSAFDLEILTTLAEQTVTAIKNAQLYEEQERIIIGSVKSLSMMLDAKIPNTYVHCPAFPNITIALGKEMGMARKALNSLYCAALLHDAGKLGMPEEVLRKKTRLSDKEYTLIRKHPIETAKILKPMDALTPAIPIILHHHERYDGKGYPSGLKGDEIPIGARIMAVVTAFDAMVCKRPYRHCATVSEATSEIKMNSGAQFDPNVVKAFLRIEERGEIKKLLKEGERR
ncbi:MAG: hypothetical protein AUJ75_00460 [Candidatus Omnitrophica bacterium CG1_02_49_10]|nr:MAG: hypothetical protein AUJ75_00460 [Candidatus Omnitrophica bacterium CG1_02_49_10]